MCAIHADDVGPFCQGCNYVLRGLKDNRCPECGRPFDPADPSTFNSGRAPGAVRRWLMQPPGWLFNTAGAAVATIIVLSARAGQAYVPMYIVSVFAGTAIVFAWGLRLLASVLLARRSPQPPRRRKAWARWAVVPLIATLTVAFLSAAAGGRSGFFWRFRPGVERRG
jgi:hypothetical protein